MQNRHALKEQISILVPCYNCESYLEKCLQNLLNINLDKDKYLIICYNDGSVDKTSKILQVYRKKHSNIHIIDGKKNKGLPWARQQLLNETKTKYFYFVDSDDFVTQDGLAKIYDIALSTDADIVLSKSYSYHVGRKPRINWFCKHFSLKKSLIYYVNNNLFYLWNVLIKTDFYRTINLNHSHSASFAEDHLFLSVLFSFNPKTTFCIQPTYHYIAHNQSEMHNASKVFKRMVDNFKNFEQICEKVMSNIKEYPILCEALINNAMYIVLMNVGMVFSYSWMGKKIRKNLDNIQIDECKEMLRSIQFFIQNNHLKIKMPSSWWKRITAFLFVHKVIKQLKKNKF